MTKFLSVLLLFFIVATKMEAMTITTWNIEFYGRGGEQSGDLKDEYRDPWIKEFREKYLPQTDFFLFEEIIDVERLKNNFHDYHCYSYDENNYSHQHVVLCAKINFNVEIKILEDLRFVKYRPAIHALISNEEKTPLFHLIGVHLKALPSGLELRKKQLKLLTEYLQALKRSSPLPIIITGDFNTYNDEASFIDSLWTGLNLSHLENSAPTYKTPFLTSTFDHFWIDKNLSVHSRISGPCAETATEVDRFLNLSFYNRFISDHCPLSLEVTL